MRVRQNDQMTNRRDDRYYEEVQPWWATPLIGLAAGATLAGLVVVYNGIFERDVIRVRT